MNRIRGYQFGVSIFLLLLFSIYSVSCTAYRWSKTTTTQLVKLKGKPLAVYVVEDSKTNKRGWFLDADSIDQQKVSGNLLLLTEEELASIRHITGNRSERLSQYHIILTVKKEYAQTLPDYKRVVIPLTEVNKVEVYEFDDAASAGKSLLAAVGTGCAVVLVVCLIALATKDSCPFIYADNSGTEVFEGEIYSGATTPQMERHDWLPLMHLQATENNYRLIIANKVKEIQYTNLLELVAIDHPQNTTVLFDKYGKLHTLSRIEAPNRAVSLIGKDVSALISNSDSLQYLGEKENLSSNASDGLILDFKRPKGSKTGKLVINAKNSFWLDHAHGLMLDQFGEYEGIIREKSLQKSTKELQSQMLRQNVPMSVWVEQSTGRWERVDYFNLAGPMALKRDVLAIDLSKIKGDRVRIKLSYGYMFWEVDQVGMDFSPDLTVDVVNLAPIAAMDQNGVDQRTNLMADDQQYYAQPNVGDESTVVFPAPPAKPGLKRSLILHSKGYYEILHTPKPGKPDIQVLKQFKKPNAFPHFAREQWRYLTGENNLVFEKGSK